MVNQAEIDYPLSDWRSKRPHTADECGLDLCPTCGCCSHGKPGPNGCPIQDGPRGAICGSTFSHSCACEGSH